MDTSALWTSYQKTCSTELRNQLVVHYMPIAKIGAARLLPKNPTVSFDDLESAAYLGLIKAVEDYRAGHKTKFETYLFQRIRGYVLDWMRDSDNQSRTIRTFERKKDRAIEKLRHNPDSSFEDLATILSMSVDRLLFLSAVSHRGVSVQLSLIQKNDEYFDPADPCSDDDPSSTIATKMFQEFVTQGLPEIEHDVVVLYYFKGLTLLRIAEKLRFSEGRISQLRIQAVGRIRRRLHREGYNRLSAA